MFVVIACQSMPVFENSEGWMIQSGIGVSQSCLVNVLRYCANEVDRDRLMRNDGVWMGCERMNG